MIAAQDELRHPAGPGEHWSESYYFSFYDEVRDVGGFFRIGLEENRQQANLWCHLIKDGKPIYNRFRLNLPYSPAGLEDISVGGLRLQLLEPLKTIRLSYIDRQLNFDLLWQGFHDVFDMREAMGELPDDVAKGHYEQSGTLKGRILFGERVIDVDGYAFRDHSWGGRNWEGVQQWKTAVGQFGAEFAYAAGEILLPNGDVSYLGLMFDGHKTTRIRKASVEVDRESRPTQGLVTLEDHDGRLTRIEMDFIYAFDMPYDFHIVHECYTRQRWNGRRGYGIVEINRKLF